MSSARILALVLLTATAACTANTDSTPEDEADTSGSAVVAKPIAAQKIEGAIAELDERRNGDVLGSWYADGDRLAGCWANPAGRKLTDLRKAFYCSYPLEFRLCNTVVLLTVNESKVEERYQGYLRCQDHLDGKIPGVSLRFSPEVNAVYKDLYLKGATPSASDTARLVAEHRPEAVAGSFPQILARIAKSLVKEGAELAIEDVLDPMVQDLQRTAGAVK